MGEGGLVREREWCKECLNTDRLVWDWMEEVRRLSTERFRFSRLGSRVLWFWFWGFIRMNDGWREIVLV